MSKSFASFVSLFLFSILVLGFSGCENSEENTNSELQELVIEQKEKEVRESAYFSFENLSDTTYGIILHNPQKLHIQSIQASFNYPSHLVDFSGFETVKSEDIFPLLLKTGEEKKGLYSFSMGQDGKAKEVEERIILGEFTLEKKLESPFHLSFFNGAEENSITVLEENKVVNVLNLNKLSNLVVE